MMPGYPKIAAIPIISDNSFLYVKSVSLLHPCIYGIIASNIILQNVLSAAHWNCKTLFQFKYKKEKRKKKKLNRMLTTITK